MLELGAARPTLPSTIPFAETSVMCLSPEDVAELAELEGYVAIKESSADPRRIPSIRRLCGDRLAVFCGVDDLALECFAVGAVGWVAGLVVAFPRETVRLYELMTAGRWDEARDLYDWFLPLLQLFNSAICRSTSMYRIVRYLLTGLSGV